MSEKLILIVFGMIFGVVGLWLLIWMILRKKRCTEAVTAVVKDLASRRGNHGRMVYAPIFEFYYGGMNYTASINYYTRPCRYSVGQEADIFIDPDDPGTIYVPKMRGLWVMGVIFTAIGLLVCYLGVIHNQG